MRMRPLCHIAVALTASILACSLPSINMPAATTPALQDTLQPPSAELTAGPNTTPTSSPATGTAVPAWTATVQRTPLALYSGAFNFGAAIPDAYTCNGQDISPPLSWTEPPAGSLSFAIIMEDPDAPGGTWDHWVIFNIPTPARGLPSGIPEAGQLSDGSLQGVNSWGGTGYRGPCPPGGTHRYIFRLYALDAMLELPAGASKPQVVQAMQGHILERAEWDGTYGE